MIELDMMLVTVGIINKNRTERIDSTNRFNHGEGSIVSWAAKSMDIGKVGVYRLASLMEGSEYCECRCLNGGYKLNEWSPSKDIGGSESE